MIEKISINFEEMSQNQINTTMSISDNKAEGNKTESQINKLKHQKGTDVEKAVIDYLDNLKDYQRTTENDGKISVGNAFGDYNLREEYFNFLNYIDMTLEKAPELKSK